MQNWTYSEVLQKAWDFIKGNLPFIAGLTLVYVVAAAVLAQIPVVGWFFSFPLWAGYVRFLSQLRASQRDYQISYQDFFWGFADLNRMAQIILVNVLVTISVTVGFIFLVIPGVWLLGSTYFANTHFILFGGDGVNSIKKSMEMVKQDWFKFFGFLCLVLLLNLAGGLCFIIGILITIPLTVLSGVIVLESSFDVARPSSHQ